MTSLDKLAAENRQHVMKLVEHKTADVAAREKLNLQNPADLVIAYSNVFREDPELYRLYRSVTSVPVKASLMD